MQQISKRTTVLFLDYRPANRPHRKVFGTLRAAGHCPVRPTWQRPPNPQRKGLPSGRLPSTCTCMTRCGNGMSILCARSAAKMARLMSERRPKVPFSGSCNPETHRELQTIGTKGRQRRRGSRIAQHAAAGQGRLGEQTDYQVHITVVNPHSPPWKATPAGRPATGFPRAG